MKTSKAIVMLTSILVLAMAVAVYAQPPEGRGPGRGGMIWQDLTPEQQKQFKDMRVEFMKKAIPIRGEIDKKRVELLELTSKDNPDEQAIQKKQQEIWALKDKVRAEKRAMKLKFRSLLTPEQRQKLGTFGGGFGFGDGKGRRHGHGGRGMCGGCPFAGGK